MHHAAPRSRAASLTLTCTLLASLPGGASAASLATYGFETADGAFSTLPTTLADGLAAGDWLDADGTLTSYAGAPGRALGARDFADGNRLSWSVRAVAGRALSPTALRFTQQASASGPKFWAVNVNGARVATGATSTAFTSIALSLAAAPRALFELTLEGFEASSALGTWRIDNFELEGAVQDAATTPTAVPLPAPLLPFIVGLALAARRSRSAPPPLAPAVEQREIDP
jgi:hypothetical protein